MQDALLLQQNFSGSFSLGSSLLTEFSNNGLITVVNGNWKVAFFIHTVYSCLIVVNVVDTRPFDIRVFNYFDYLLSTLLKISGGIIF